MRSCPVRARKSQPAIAQPSARRCRSLQTNKQTNKYTPHPQPKDKPQQDGRRSAIMIKSNPILARWITHKLRNNNTKEVLPLLWMFCTPHQASQPGDQTKELNLQGIWPAWFDYRFSTGLRETKTPVLEGTNNILCIPTSRGKEQGPHRWLNQNYQLVLEGLLWRWGSPGVHHMSPQAKQLPGRECTPPVSRNLN